MTYGVIGIIVIAIILLTIFNTAEKNKYIATGSLLIKQIEAALGSFIEECDEKKYLDSIELHRKVAIDKNYKFDEALSFINYADKLPKILYEDI